MIRAFIQTSLIDWDGRISMVVFFDRCDFHCPFCHNWRLLDRRHAGKEISPADILVLAKKKKKWIDGVVLSGGEPLAYGKQAMEFMRDVKTIGLAVKLDTHGYHFGNLRRAIGEGLVDYVAVDIKAPFEPLAYARAAGLGKQRPCRLAIDRIKRSIALLMAGGIDHEFRTTCVPGIIDGSAIREIGQAIRGAKKWALQSYRPENARCKEGFPRGYDLQEMKHLLAIARQYVPGAILRGGSAD